MSELKTIEHKGIVAQLNTVYSLKDGTHVVLDGSDTSGFLVSRVDGDNISFNVSQLYPSLLVAGTITKAPVKLVDGKAYQFDCDEKARNGLYNKQKDLFILVDGAVPPVGCTNIQPLTVEGE